MQTSRQTASRATLWVLLATITTLLLTACGGGDDDVPTQQCYVSGKPVDRCEVIR